jgi:type IV fimbrial biogenesis protein FimT
MNADRASRQTGFSLIELLVTVTLLSILLALGVPAFTDLIASTKLTSATNTLIGHLHYARAEAIKRGRGRIAVGPYETQTTWLESQSWEGGYMVAAVGATSITTPEVLRRVDGANLTSIKIKKNGSTPRFFFDTDGSASGIGTLTICDPNNAKHKRGVVVDRIGRVRVSNYTSEGDPLTCP